MDLGSKIDFLLRPKTQLLMETLQEDSRDELALSRSPLLKSFGSAERIVLLEQRALRRKAAKKVKWGSKLVLTPIGLEQMTSEILSRHKAARFFGGPDVIGDFCCGLGGDSFFLPSGKTLVGVDRDSATLKAYRFNTRLLRDNVAAVQADVSMAPVRVDAVLLDPARRRGSDGKRWDGSDLSPGWNQLERIINRFGNIAIKLGPGTSLPNFLLEHELEYLGLNDECLELVVWTGNLGERGLVRATELPEGESLHFPREDLQDSFQSLGPPGEFLYEPTKAVIRAHLFGVLASRLGLWQLDPRIAYLSGNLPLRHPLLKSYKIRQILPYDLKDIQTFLRKEDVGRMEIKKRGLDLIPEKIRARLKLGGENSGILIFTRVLNKKTAFWVDALG